MVIQIKTKTNKTVFFPLNRIYTILIFFFVNCILNAQKVDSLILSKSFNKFKYHLTYDKYNYPFLIGHEKYVELEGFNSYTLDPKKITPYNQIDLSEVYSVNVDSKIYIVSKDGSTVYNFDNGFGLKQLNDPDTTKSYFKCSIFSYGGSIYRIGGYGYFQNKSQLFKFDFKNNRWRFIKNILKDNFGFINPHTLVLGDKVYLISRYTINNFNNKRSKTDYVYSIDLDDYNIDKYKFDYTDYSEYLNEFFYRTNYFKTKNGIGFINRQDEAKAMIFDFKNQTSSLVELDSPVNTHSKIIYHDNKLFFLDLDDSDSNPTDVGTEIVHISVSKINKIHKEKPFKKTNFTTEITILSIAFSVFFIVYFKRKRRPFVLEKKYIKMGDNSIKLNVDEKYFVKCLVKDGIVENQTLISYFDSDGKSYDLNVKRKSSMISKLSLKFYAQFKKDLFIKAPSTIDKRQGVYVLKQKLILANNKS